MNADKAPSPPDESNQRRKQAGHWLLWWKIDPTEIDEQVSKYGTLSFVRSARGESILCLLFSVLATAVMAALGNGYASYVDAALFAILAMFIYLGHRWAMITAMVLWTFEKLYLIIVAVSAQKANGGLFITQVIWWCIYMHAFYLAYRVEQARRAIFPASNAA